MGERNSILQPVTYSIVAYDPESRQFGVAVQTHQPAVGAIAPLVRAGVGAVATPAMANVVFGPLGLEMMAGGLSAQQALAALLAGDECRTRDLFVQLQKLHCNYCM